MNSLETPLAAAAGYWIIQAVWSSLAGVFWFKCEGSAHLITLYACWPVYMYARWSVISMPSGSKLSSWQKEKLVQNYRGVIEERNWGTYNRLIWNIIFCVEIANRSRIDPIELGDWFDRLTRPARSISESPTVFKLEALWRLPLFLIEDYIECY